MKAPNINTAKGLAKLIQAQIQLAKIGEATGGEFNWENIIKNYAKKQVKLFSSKSLLPAVAWVAIADDDFVFRKGKYSLRVEQMDKKYWWWCVYYGKEYAGFDKPRAKTETEAKLLAELCFIRARASNSR